MAGKAPETGRPGGPPHANRGTFKRISMAASAKGNTPGLVRQLGFYSATALVISNMVGTGIFTTTGYMAADLGSAWLILACWGAGALFALAGALSYSELGINFPSSGGEYVYLTRAFGPEWGFMTGWVSFFAGFSAPIAATALAVADYLDPVFPGLEQGHAALVLGSGKFALRIGAGHLFASGLIAAFTMLNCFGAGKTARVQNVLTSTKVVVIVGFVVLGLAFGDGHWSHFSQNAVRTSTASLPVQFLVSLLWVMFGYSGWNAATYVAEEIRNPERTLPKALGAGAAIVAVFYLALNLVFIYATPLENMKQITAIGVPSAQNLFGASIGRAFSALIALCLMSTVLAEVTIGPRVYFAMAKNRAFFSAAARVHPRWRTPVVAIASQGVCAILMTATPFPELVTYIAMSLTIFTVLSVVSVFVFRKRQPGWQRLRALNFAWPLIPASYIAVGVCMVVFGFTQHPWASLTAFGTVGIGALVYHFGLREQAQ
jgi:APA family basic amino acid/polyamine antiporter